jgi:hypothetical protein
MIERIYVIFSKFFSESVQFMCTLYTQKDHIYIGCVPYLDVFQAIFEVNMGHSFLETNVLCMRGL